MANSRVRNVQRRIGANLRSARERRGITQAIVAEMAGVEMRTVQSLEAGVTARLATIVAVADAVRVPLAELFRARPPTAARKAGRPRLRRGY